MFYTKEFIMLTLIILFVIVNSQKHGFKCMNETMALAKCCQLPPETYSSKLLLDMNECKSLEPTGEGRELYKSMICHSECVFKKTGISNASGEVDKAKYIHATESFLKDHPEFEAIALASIDKCMEYANNRKHGKPEGDDKKCDKLPFKLSMCTLREIVRNCPPSKQIHSDECKELRVKVTSQEDCMKKN